MKKLWLAFEQLIEGNAANVLPEHGQDINYWKNRLFINFSKYFLPVSLIALIPGIYLSLKTGVESVAVVDISCFLVLAFVFTSGKLTLGFKKGVVISIFYLLATFLVGILGYQGPAALCFFGINILTILVLPVAYAYASIVINGLIIIAFALVIQFRLFDTPLISQFTPQLWLTVNANLVFLNVLAVVLIHYIFNSLQLSILAKDQMQSNYRNIFKLSPLPMFLFDAETLKFLTVNEAAIRHYGYTKEELLNLKITDLHPLSTREEDEKLIRMNIQNARFYGGTANHVKKNGRQIKVKVESNTIFYNGLAARLVLATDVSRQLHFEREMIKSNKRLRAAQQIGKIGYWEYDCAAEAIYWSDQMYKIFELDKSTFTPSLTSFQEQVHLEDWEMFITSLMPSFEKSTKTEIEYRVVCSLNPNQFKFIHQVATFSYDETGQLVRVEGTIQDVTESKQSQLKLKESELNLRAIFESAVEGFVLLDRDWKIRVFNTKATEFSKLLPGLPPLKTGSSILEYIESFGHGEFAGRIGRVWAGEPVEYDKEFKLTEKSSLWVRFILTPVYENNEVIGVCLAGRDVTAKKEYIHTIEEQNKTFQKISWSQSHLVRAPLSRILGLTALLKNELTDEEREEMINYLETSANELDDIIKSISDMMAKTSELVNFQDRQ